MMTPRTFELHPQTQPTPEQTQRFIFELPDRLAMLRYAQEKVDFFMKRVAPNMCRYEVFLNEDARLFLVDVFDTQAGQRPKVNVTIYDFLVGRSAMNNEDLRYSQKIEEVFNDAMGLVTAQDANPSKVQTAVTVKVEVDVPIGSHAHRGDFATAFAKRLDLKTSGMRALASGGHMPSASSFFEIQLMIGGQETVVADVAFNPRSLLLTCRPELLNMLSVEQRTSTALAQLARGTATQVFGGENVAGDIRRQITLERFLDSNEREKLVHVIGSKLTQLRFTVDQRWQGVPSPMPIYTIKLNDQRVNDGAAIAEVLFADEKFKTPLVRVDSVDPPRTNEYLAKTALDAIKAVVPDALKQEQGQGQLHGTKKDAEALKPPDAIKLILQLKPGMTAADREKLLHAWAKGFAITDVKLGEDRLFGDPNTIVISGKRKGITRSIELIAAEFKGDSVKVILNYPFMTQTTPVPKSAAEAESILRQHSGDLVLSQRFRNIGTIALNRQLSEAERGHVAKRYLTIRGKNASQCTLAMPTVGEIVMKNAFDKTFARMKFITTPDGKPAVNLEVTISEGQSDQSILSAARTALDEVVPGARAEAKPAQATDNYAFRAVYRLRDRPWIADMTVEDWEFQFPKNLGAKQLIFAVLARDKCTPNRLAIRYVDAEISKREIFYAERIYTLGMKNDEFPKRREVVSAEILITKEGIAAMGLPDSTEEIDQRIRATCFQRNILAEGERAHPTGFSRIWPRPYDEAKAREKEMKEQFLTLLVANLGLSGADQVQVSEEREFYPFRLPDDPRPVLVNFPKPDCASSVDIYFRAGFLDSLSYAARSELPQTMKHLLKLAETNVYPETLAGSLRNSGTIELLRPLDAAEKSRAVWNYMKIMGYHKGSTTSTVGNVVSIVGPEEQLCARMVFSDPASQNHTVTLYEKNDEPFSDATLIDFAMVALTDTCGKVTRRPMPEDGRTAILKKLRERQPGYIERAEPAPLEDRIIKSAVCELPAAVTQAQAEQLYSAFAQRYGIEKFRISELTARWASREYRMFGHLRGALLPEEENLLLTFKPRENGGKQALIVDYSPVLIHSLPKDKRTMGAIEAEAQELVNEVLRPGKKAQAVTLPLDAIKIGGMSRIIDPHKLPEFALAIGYLYYGVVKYPSVDKGSNPNELVVWGEINGVSGKKPFATVILLPNYEIGLVPNPEAWNRVPKHLKDPTQVQRDLYNLLERIWWDALPADAAALAVIGNANRLTDDRFISPQKPAVAMPQQNLQPTAGLAQEPPQQISQPPVRESAASPAAQPAQASPSSPAAPATPQPQTTFTDVSHLAAQAASGQTGVVYPHTYMVELDGSPSRESLNVLVSRYAPGYRLIKQWTGNLDLVSMKARFVAGEGAQDLQRVAMQQAAKVTVTSPQVVVQELMGPGGLLKLYAVIGADNVNPLLRHPRTTTDEQARWNRVVYSAKRILVAASSSSTLAAIHQATGNNILKVDDLRFVDPRAARPTAITRGVLDDLHDIQGMGKQLSSRRGKRRH